MNGVLRDVRFGLRLIRRSPGSSAAAVLSLALGIGAGASIFSLVDALGLRPLPVTEENRLARVATEALGQPPGDSSYPDYADLRDRNHVFAAVTAHGIRGVVVRGASGEPGIGFVDVATWNYFKVLGVRPALGRTFLPDDDRPGAAPVTVIGHRLWQQRFTGDPHIVGKSIRLTGIECTVVGVAPRGFTGTVPLVVPDVWVPMMLWPRLTRNDGEVTDRDSRWLEIVGRLKEGVSFDQARAEAATISAQLASEHPATNRNRRAIVIRESTARRQQVATIGPLLLAGVAIVLLIACINVAGLLMARGEARRVEVAMRAALGAGRGRLVRQLLTESSLLSSLAACGGVLLAAWTTRVLPLLMPASPIALDLNTQLDGRAVMFALLVSLIVLPVFGLLPALVSLKPGIAPLLRGAGSPIAASSRLWLRHLLVVGQIAVSLVLLSSAGLLVRSVLNSQRMDLGFERRPMLLVTMIPPVAGYDERGSRQMYERLLGRVSSLPGVEGTTLARCVPLSPFGGFAARAVAIPGHTKPGEAAAKIRFNIVHRGYFTTMGTRIVRGRDFTSADGPDAPRVILVNQAMATRFWPNDDPVGRYVRLPGASTDCRIIGVVQDGQYVRLGEETLPLMYFPFDQMFSAEMTLVVRTAGQPGAVAAPLRQVLREMAPGVPTLRMMTLDEHLQLATRTTRTAATVGVVLGVLGLLFAVVGLYGMVAYVVSRRTREFGIRMALGANPGVLQRQVLQQGLWVAATGITIGLLLAFAAGHLLRGMLLGVSAVDPLTLGASAVVIGGVTLWASYLPARQASHVDPLRALRQE